MIESLRDAIEDVQYLHEGKLPPSRPFPYLAEKEIQAFMEDLRIRRPEAFELEKICEEPLGFYLFTKFLKGIEAADLANFLIESASLQMNRSNNATKILRHLVYKYLSDDPKGGTVGDNAPQSSFHFVPNLVRAIEKDIVTETEDNHVSIKHRRDNSLKFSGAAVEAILNKLGVTGDRHPLSGQTVATPTQSPRAASQNGQQNQQEENSSSSSGPAGVSPFVRTGSSSSSKKLPPTTTFPQQKQQLLNTSGGSNDAHLDRMISTNTEINIKELMVLDTLVFNIVHDRYYKDFTQSEEWKLYFRLKAVLANHSPVERDFEKIRVLGRGGFGLVHAVKSCTTGKLYAMKVIDKRRIKKRKAAEVMCIAEREALEAIDSPFVISLKYAFSTSFYCFLVMDLMIGGDLCYHLHLRENHCFTFEETKFYTARTVLGLSILHLNSFIYRDLKPENILLDSEGFSKLSDLGLAIFIDERKGATGVCGTRGYWAPEMLRSVDGEVGGKARYYFEVDWFSLGCCVYEFLMGVSPFRTEEAKHYGGFDITTRQGKDRAMDMAVLEMQPDLSGIVDEDCRDFIAGLLVKDPSKRLGAKGFQEIANHQWFHDISWETLHCIPPPFKPERKDNTVKGSEIDPFEDEREISHMKLDLSDQEYYNDWNYTSQKGVQEEIVEYLADFADGEIPDLFHSNQHCCTIS